MAIAIPHRPRYRDRGLPIYYLVDGRMILRSRPHEVHDPRTPAQLRQRLRLRVASTFLKGFQPMVAQGFSPEIQENFRKVGAYQQALGHLMRNALVETPDGFAVDMARVQLAEGRTNPLGTIRAARAGGRLRVAWSNPLPRGCQQMLVGVWSRGHAQPLCQCIEISPGEQSVTLSLPSGWATDTLDVWVAPWGPGARARYESQHIVSVVEDTVQPLPTGKLADLPLAKRKNSNFGVVRRRRVRVADVYSGRRE